MKEDLCMVDPLGSERT